MAWGLWNKIKKGMQKVKNKVLPAMQKGAKFISANKDLINSSIDLVAPKLGINSDVAHSVVNTIGSFAPKSKNYLENADIDQSATNIFGSFTPKTKDYSINSNDTSNANESFIPKRKDYLEDYGEPPDDTHYMESGGMIKPVYK